MRVRGTGLGSDGLVMHRIRLRSLWQRRSLPRDEAVSSVLRPAEADAAEGTRVDLPDEISLGSPPALFPPGSSFCYERFFHAPTGIEHETDVFLKIESWQGRLTVLLDGEVLVADVVAGSQHQSQDRIPRTLAADDAVVGDAVVGDAVVGDALLSFCITSRLRRRHCCQLHLHGAAGETTIGVGLVWLEITPPPATAAP